MTKLETRIAEFAAQIQEDRASERALDPFSRAAERRAVQARIARNVEGLETVASMHAKAESRAAGYPCTQEGEALSMPEVETCGRYDHVRADIRPQSGAVRKFIGRGECESCSRTLPLHVTVHSRNGVCSECAEREAAQYPTM